MDRLHKPMYIAGVGAEGDTRYPVVCPASDEVIGGIAWAGAEDAKRALEAAEAACSTWGAASVDERIGWMHRLRSAVLAEEEHLRECIHLEMGKPWAQTEEDFRFLCDSLTFYADEITRLRPEVLVDRAGTHRHVLMYEPIGVTVASIAWNFPLLNLAFKLGPAMAAGSPIVIKPSFKAPLSAYAVGELCAEIGLPAGVVNILCGEDEVVGDTLSSSRIPALITLIGSVRTGRRIMERGASSIKRYSMELGGNAPALVFADADLGVAADVVSATKFGNAGQICVAPNRILVHEDVVDEFGSMLVERARKLVVGHDRRAEIDMGPLIDKPAWEHVSALVEEAVAEGAKVLTGGGRPPGATLGHYYAPTVLGDVRSQMRICWEEIFGPVASVIAFRSEEAAITEANDTEAGLTSYVFTRDVHRADRCARRLQFGEVHVNGVKHAIDLPHIGMKQSGLGCDCSHLALHDYLTTKRITQPVAAADHESEHASS